LGQNGSPQPTWRRSTRCEGGQCVEVALLDDAAAMRDGKDPERGELLFSHREWAHFLGAVRAGAFDRAR